MKTINMTYFKSVLIVFIGYIIGSIPWALIVGKVFYGVDIRKHGSGNLGGTNALRTLGKIPGIAVMLLDALKAFIYMVVVNVIDSSIIQYAGLAVCVGHCFPIFANFKGGKAVACSCGYILALNILIEHKTIYTFIIPGIIWLITLLSTRYMSLASILGLLSSSILGFIFYQNKTNAILVLILSAFVIYMHRANIKRLLNKTENKL